MPATAGGLVSTSAGNARSTFVSESSLKFGGNFPWNLSMSYCDGLSVSKKPPLTIRASWDDGRSSSAGIFVGGFVFGGIIVGALGCVYAPQISKSLAVANRRELMSRLPIFIYDEEKALE